MLYLVFSCFSIQFSTCLIYISVWRRYDSLILCVWYNIIIFILLLLPWQDLVARIVYIYAKKNFMSKLVFENHQLFGRFSYQTWINFFEAILINYGFCWLVIFWFYWWLFLIIYLFICQFLSPPLRWVSFFLQRRSRLSKLSSLASNFPKTLNVLKSERKWSPLNRTIPGCKFYDIFTMIENDFFIINCTGFHERFSKSVPWILIFLWCSCLIFLFYYDFINILYFRSIMVFKISLNILIKLLISSLFYAYNMLSKIEYAVIFLWSKGSPH